MPKRWPKRRALSKRLASILVDLNLGCPAKRVVGCNGGSGLLRDLPKIGEIFRAVRKAVTIPFTVKFRLGWNDTQIVCVELARMAEAKASTPSRSTPAPASRATPARRAGSGLPQSSRR